MDISKIIDHIGYNGPFILTLSTALLLRNMRKMLFIFCFGTIINSAITFILKMLIKQSRPIGDNLEIEILHVGNKRTTGDMYGMPSGHAQMAFFATTFMFCVLRDYYLLGLFLVTSFITLKQRYDYKNHTLSQLIVGTILGSVFGYLFYFLARQYVS